MNETILYPTIDIQGFRDLISKVYSTPIAVVFTADWLGEGRLMDSIIEKLAGDFKTKLNFYRLDLGNTREFASKWGIQHLPAVLFYEEGQIIDKVSGIVPKKVLCNRIRNILN